MDLEIVTVGAELLLGLTVDSNAAEIARALTPIGARVVRKGTVPDDETVIGHAVREALERTGAVIVTGGLGPTRDDVTKQAVASLFGMPLVVDEEYLARLEDRWAQLGRGGKMPEANRTQADVPRGATVLPNRTGTAPGLWLEGPAGLAVLLPGVPREMRSLMRDEVVPRLAKRMQATGTPLRIRSHVLRTTGIAESALADFLRETEAAIGREGVSLAFLPSLDGVDLRLMECGHDGERRLETAVGRLRSALGAYCFADGETELAAVVVERLATLGARLAVAESCTGGLVGGRITDVPGASRVFAGGVIAYANEVKERELGVPAAMLEAHGAVSEPTVRAMAQGVCRRFAADAALAVSGVAGPDGGTPDKPVGTIWIAAQWGERERVLHVRLPGDRHDIRHRAVQASLDVLRRLLEPDSR